MRELRDAGSCVLIVTHRIAEMTRIADRVTVLRDGRDVGVLAKGRHHRSQSSPADGQQSGARRPSAARPGRGRAAAQRRHESRRDENLAAQPRDRLSPASWRDPRRRRTRGPRAVGLRPHARGRAAGGRHRGRSSSASTAASTRSIRLPTPRATRSLTFPATASARASSPISASSKTCSPRSIARSRAAESSPSSTGRRSRGSFEWEREKLSIRMGDRGDKITSLSGGNQQKVLIGRAFALSPNILILNDPARGVDIGAKTDLYAPSAGLCRGGQVGRLHVERDRGTDRLLLAGAGLPQWSRL